MVKKKSVTRNRTYDRLGKQSLLTSLLAALATIALFYWAIATRGQAPGVIGGLAFITLIATVLGIRKGWRGLQERTEKARYCRLGIFFNLLLLLLLAAVFFHGIF